jgi:hypothetical protein
MQTSVDRVCEHPSCDKTLTKQQSRFCSKSHAAYATKSWTYIKRPERNLNPCKMCSKPVKYNFAYCSEECKKQGKLQTVLAFCLKDGPSIKSASLKHQLFRIGLLTAECTWCGLTEWRGLKGPDAPLQMDHINGDKYDNRLENLRILCGNCHMQTPTYCGRNKSGVQRRSKVV